MYFDANLLLSGSISAANVITGQTVTGTGNVLSTNTIDLLQARDMGEGEDLWARFQITTAFAGCTSVEFQAVQADDAGLTTNLTVVDSSGAIPLAQLVLGARFALNINPRVGKTGQRYLGVRYVIVGTASAGVVVTDVGQSVQDGQKFYPSGFAII